jgi:NTE family protein
MANTPILPALERGVKEIIVVLLSPVGGARLELPATRRQAIERVFEQSLIGSYQAFMAHLAWEQKLKGESGFFERLARRTLTLGDVRIATIAPDRMLGFQSLLNFSARQVDVLLRAGYNDARTQLSLFFNRTEA